MECVSDIVHAWAICVHSRFWTSLAPPTATQQTAQSVSKGIQAEQRSRQMDPVAKIDHRDATATSVAGLKW